MTYVVAVSGGVDSVSLLDMMIKAGQRQLVVAHFDHGIRDDSRDDAEFVASLARAYDVPFETKREELGPLASEATARERRYAFLREVADRYNAKIVTAHHNDDLAETVAINFLRGTGWRGLAVLDSDVSRPLLAMSKEDILGYAQHHGLEWREDSTNASDAYLRNRIRPQVQALSSDSKRELHALQQQQRALKRDIEQEVIDLMGEGPLYSRYSLTHMSKTAAIECLRVISNGKLTRPQLERALLAIKTAFPGNKHQAGNGVTLTFTTRYFTL